MIATSDALLAIAVMTVVTVLLRALPFLATGLLRRFPLILQLGGFLPPAIMTLLLVHTLRSGMADNPGGAWQELAAAAVAIALQWRLRQPLASILGATALYVAFRNML